VLVLVGIWIFLISAEHEDEHQHDSRYQQPRKVL
jgi:hypothetical protein